MGMNLKKSPLRRAPFQGMNLMKKQSLSGLCLWRNRLLSQGPQNHAISAVNAAVAWPAIQPLFVIALSTLESFPIPVQSVGAASDSPQPWCVTSEPIGVSVRMSAMSAAKRLESDQRWFATKERFTQARGLTFVGNVVRPMQTFQF